MPRVRRSNPEGLPPRVYLRHGTYYYASPAGPWHPLGHEWDLGARVKWAGLAGENAPQGSVSALLGEYRKIVIPEKAQRTQADNRVELQRIEAVFGRMALADLRLRHAAAYLEARGARVRGNREMALFAHVLRWGMNKGLCNYERHPFDGLMYNRERARTRLVSDAELERFLAFASCYCPVIAALTRAMYLTAQRRGDLLALRVGAIGAEGVQVIQSKTGAKLLIEWSDELRAVVDEARAVRRDFVGMFLFCTRSGAPYSDAGIKSMWARTMRAAMSAKFGPPVIVDRFRMQDMRPKAVSDVGGGKRGKDLAGHKTQATTDRVYDRVTFKRVRPTR